MSQQGSGTTILDQDTYEQINYRPFSVNRLNNNVGEKPIVGIPMVRDSNFRTMDMRQKLTRDSKFFFGQGHQNRARLGQSLPSLPSRGRDMRTSQVAGAKDHACKCEHPQDGGNFFKDVGKTVKKVGKFVSKEVKKAKKSGIVGDLLEGAATGAAFLGQPELAAPLAGAAAFTKKSGFGDKRRCAQCGGSFFGDVKKFGEKVVKGVKSAAKSGIVGKTLEGAAKAADFVGLDAFGKPLKQASKFAKKIGFGQGRLAQARAEMHRNFPGPRGNDRQSFVSTHPLNFNKARLDTL